MYYLTVIFCYFLISVYIIICHNPLKFKNHIFPDINLLSYSLNPIYNDNYEGENNENVKVENEVRIYDKRNILRIFFCILLCIILLYSTYVSTILNKEENRFLQYFKYFLLILLIFSLSIILNFPFCYKNHKTVGSFLNSKKN